MPDRELNAVLIRILTGLEKKRVEDITEIRNNIEEINRSINEMRNTMEEAG